MAPRVNLTGRKYGKLVVIGLDGSRFGKNHWFCKCVCGKTIAVAVNNLTRGQSSCGCVHNEWVGNMARTHGMSRSAEYRIWNGIKNRCLNKKLLEYKHYGGRGITVCQEWANDFNVFYKDMGDRPKGKSIERIDNNKGYNKSNCKWATTKEQSINKRCSLRVEYMGKQMALTEISDITGIKYVTLARKLKVGEDLSNIISVKERRVLGISVDKIKTLIEKGKTAAQIAVILKAPVGSIKYRIERYINGNCRGYWKYHKQINDK